MKKYFIVWICDLCEHLCVYANSPCINVECPCMCKHKIKFEIVLDLKKNKYLEDD